MIDTTRYAPLRRGGKALARLAFWVQVGSVMWAWACFSTRRRGSSLTDI